MTDEEVKRLDFAGWPLPDNYLIEIGRISALWGSLESFLNICIGKLAGFDDLNDPKHFILVTHTSFPQRIDILGALCEQLAPEFPSLANYSSLISLLKSAQKLRNTFAHNQISRNTETGKVEMAVGSARGRLDVGVRAVELHDIRRASTAINEANRALYKLVLGSDLMPPWESKTKKR
jgi:hypothetical protein